MFIIIPGKENFKMTWIVWILLKILAGFRSCLSAVILVCHY